MFIYQPVVKYPHDVNNDFECREVFTEHGKALVHGSKVALRIGLDSHVVSVNRYILDDEGLSADQSSNGNDAGDEVSDPPINFRKA